MSSDRDQNEGDTMTARIGYTVVPDKHIKAHGNRDAFKMLYGEIIRLSRKNGFCNASNSYFAKTHGKHKRTVQRWIKVLKEEHLIDIEFVHHDRKIYLHKKTLDGYGKIQ